MRPGARSIRGAMGAYFWASLAALAALAVALAWGGRRPSAEAAVVLQDAGAWTGATLRRGAETHALEPGARVVLPAGLYQVTLIGPAGRASVGERQLRAGETLVLEGDG